MAALANSRHEAFAQAFAEGMSATAAYVKAGYKPSRQCASRLLTKADIKARVQELKDMAADETVLTIVEHMQKLAHLRDMAADAGQFAAAISAETNRGKCAGLYVERSESVNTNYVVYAEEEAISSDEWEAQHSELHH